MNLFRIIIIIQDNWLWDRERVDVSFVSYQIELLLVEVFFFHPVTVEDTSELHGRNVKTDTKWLEAQNSLTELFLHKRHGALVMNTWPSTCQEQHLGPDEAAELFNCKEETLFICPVECEEMQTESWTAEVMQLGYVSVDPDQLNQNSTQVLARVSLLTKCSQGPMTPAVLHSVPLVYPRDGFIGFVYYEVWTDRRKDSLKTKQPQDVCSSGINNMLKSILPHDCSIKLDTLYAFLYFPVFILYFTYICQ